MVSQHTEIMLMLNKMPFTMALLVISTLALLGGTAPTTHDITPTGSDGVFSSYCMTPQYFGRELGGYGMFEAYCSSTEGGAHLMGAQLALSLIDLNDCLANDNGNLTKRIQ
ncbi:hypothetical protein SLS53_001098 [Cytospora paraplurivora]|uniref:Cyanovirin-N domain-containing protein n=1 Tax=Cytospora paraplurivora TaxID=2898453 RepID=A0AAN9UGD3_9PEZI